MGYFSEQDYTRQMTRVPRWYPCGIHLVLMRHNLGKVASWAPGQQVSIAVAQPTEDLPPLNGLIKSQKVKKAINTVMPTIYRGYDPLHLDAVDPVWMATSDEPRPNSSTGA
jgi:hypothetical protein